MEPSAYHTDFTVITANVQAAAQDIPVRAVVFVTSLLHYLRHDFLCTDIDDRPLLRPGHKMTPKWAWPGSRDRILHSKDELHLPADVTSKVNDMFINNKGQIPLV